MSAMSIDDDLATFVKSPPRVVYSPLTFSPQVAIPRDVTMIDLTHVDDEHSHPEKPEPRDKDIVYEVPGESTITMVCGVVCFAPISQHNLSRAATIIIRTTLAH